MAVKPITKEQFDLLQPACKPMTRLMVEEHEWFAVEDGSFIGAVFYETAEHDWGWVIQGREGQAEFRVVQMISRLPNHDEARTKLREEMTRREAAAKRVIPQVA